MRAIKRLRVIVAALTQRWSSFTCACGADVWVSESAGKLLDGQQCAACEAKAFEAWMESGSWTVSADDVKTVKVKVD